MLNEAPKKEKKPVDYSHPTKWRLFWRIQRESWRRMVTPFLMYFFMSLILLALFQLVTNKWALLVIMILCIGIGGFFNGHLCYHYGMLHYGFYVAGELHRKNEAYGIHSGGDHRPEREYRPWKGFYIGFLIGVPVILLGSLSGRFYDTLGGGYATALLIMVAAWAIVPLLWVRNFAGVAGVSLYWSLLMVIVPIVVSGVFYIVGAMRERKNREEEAERSARIEEARVKAQNEVRVQTEEQRKKTLQSKKKK